MPNETVRDRLLDPRAQFLFDDDPAAAQAAFELLRDAAAEIARLEAQVEELKRGREAVTHLCQRYQRQRDDMLIEIRHSHRLLDTSIAGEAAISVREHLRQIIETIDGVKAAVHDGKPQTFDELKLMMLDPMYWRDGNPDYVAKIQRGFDRLSRLHPPTRTVEGNDDDANQDDA